MARRWPMAMGDGQPPPPDVATADTTEASLSSALLDPSLSDPILSFLSLTELNRFKSTSPSGRRAVVSHLDPLPAMVVLGGLSIDLGDDDGTNKSLGSMAQISSSVGAFRPSTMDWYTLPPLPTPRFAAAVCSLPDGRIVVAGGIVELGRDAVANPSVVVERHRGTTTASTIARPHQPRRERGSSDWRGRCSQRGVRTDAVEVFDPRTSRWTALPPLPQPRAGARACLDATGARLLVVGGSTHFRPAAGASRARLGRAFSRDVEVFDVGANRWLDDADFPPMRSARTEFALSRVPGRGIFVCGGTNRYLWPGTPIQSEFYDFATGRWTATVVDAARAARTEEIGADCALLGDGRHVVVCGGLRVETEEEGSPVPRGAGYESSDESSEDEFDDEEEDEAVEGVAGGGPVRRSERDCWWQSDGGGGGYDKRASRSCAIGVYDLDAERWLSKEEKDDEGKLFDDMARARTGCGVWRARDAIFVVGGNYELYGKRGHYLSHGTTEEVFLIDGHEGKRLRLPMAKYLGGGVMSPGIASLNDIQALAEKHGWQVMPPVT